MWSYIVLVLKKQFMTKVNTEDKQYVYKEPMSIKEILIGIAEGLAFLFFLGSLILIVKRLSKELPSFPLSNEYKLAFSGTEILNLAF